MEQILSIISHGSSVWRYGAVVRTQTGNDTAADVRSTILTAAEACFDRYGINKTTMEDVARAAEMSRATLYRYFSDRESLIIESVARRARMNMEPARTFIAQWPTLTDKITEGICQNVRRGHRDPVVQLLVSPAEMTLASSLLTASGMAAELTRELWEPILLEAQEAGELRTDIDVGMLCQWISELEIMYLSQPTHDEDALQRFRYKLTHFFIPALLPGDDRGPVRSSAGRGRRKR
jgi:AcrR family transcriptional regulator